MKKFVFLGAGVVSGFVSSYLYKMAAGQYDVDYIYPGLTFALFIFLCLPSLKGFKQLFFKIIWFPGCILGYSAAVRIFVGANGGGVGGGMADIILAGAIGTLITLFFFHLAFNKLSPLQFIVLTILGGVISYPALIIGVEMENVGFDLLRPFDFLGLFVIWQAVMALGLGWVIDRNNKKLV